MRFIILILLGFLNIPLVLAGQEGSGGNVCLVRIDCPSADSCGVRTVYRLLDELTHVQRTAVRDERNFPLLPVNGFAYVDVTKTPAGIKTKDILKDMRSEAPAVADYFLSIFERFRFQRVMSEGFNRPFRGAFEPNDFGCTEFNAEAGFVLWSEGYSILSLDAWNKLDVTSQSVLLIHEILRFDMKNFHRTEIWSERDLQHATMLISSGRFSKFVNTYADQF